jgi:hypothetical protein
MIAIPLGATRVDEALRAARALGAHRYVAGRAHLVHAFALAAVAERGDAALARAIAWARAVLDDPRVDAASRDQALWRRCSDAELAMILEAYWALGETARSARQGLRALLEGHDCVPKNDAAFDESVESEIHPLLVDAGWELLPLSQLDAERHKGAIAAFGSALAFDSARFDEETAIPVRVHLYELPALGPTELLYGVDEGGTLAAPLVVWAEGNETYLDYVLRGVRRAAKLPEIVP